MIDNKNIPDAGKSWVQAERLLDRHFRLKKLRKALLLISVPVLIILGLLLLPGKKSVVENPVSQTANTSTADIRAGSSAPAEGKTESATPSSMNKIKVPKGNAAAVTKMNNADISENDKSKLPLGNQAQKHSVNSNTAINTNKSSAGSASVDLTGKDVSTGVENKTTTSARVKNTKVSRDNAVPASPLNSTASGNASSVLSVSSPATVASSKADNRFTEEISVDAAPASLYQSTEKPNGELNKLWPLTAMISPPSNATEAGSQSWPKPVNTAPGCNVSWELSFLGGAHRVSKTLETKNDWDNYLLHRKNEEESVILPSLGVSLAAVIKSMTFSVGAEYAVYGERTNYYPYSLQPTYINRSGWQTYLTNYVDTDTAYVTGNQYFLQSIVQRQDSAFVTESDTIEEYKYDQDIASKNGVNRIYYLEIPLEVSYCFTRGRTGFGVSGGVAPAILTVQRGHYLRTDGRGIESMEDIKTFRKFTLNARLSADFYYRFSARGKFVLRPQIRSGLNSIFEKSSGINQRYYSTGVLFGVSYLLK